MIIGKFGDFIEKAANPEGHIWKEISEIGLNEEQIRNVKKNKAPVLKLREKICKEMGKFLEIKKKIIKLSKEIESTFDKTGAKIYPIQRAKFLLYVDKVKSKKELSVFELWGVKKNGFKITKTFKKNLENFPTIKREHDMILKKKLPIDSVIKSEDEEIIKIYNEEKERETKYLQDGSRPRLSQDSLESKEYEWHNYIYDQLDR